MDIVRGRIVRSKAGRDKDTFYIVVKSDEAVWVANGRERKLSSPKRKNPKHLALTATVLSVPETDKQLRRALRDFGADFKED